MDPLDDSYLGTLLKNWAAQSRPPVQLRPRLLWLAAQTVPASEPPYLRDHASRRMYVSLHWPVDLLTWRFDHPFQVGLPSAYLLV